MAYRENTMGVRRLTGGGDDTGWIAPTLLNGWTQYGASWDCLFRRKNGVTYVRGLVQRPAGALNAVLFYLPTGFRPAYNYIFNPAVAQSSTINQAIIYAQVDGAILITAGADNIWTSVNGMTFIAEQ